MRTTDAICTYLYFFDKGEWCSDAGMWPSQNETAGLGQGRHT